MLVCMRQEILPVSQQDWKPSFENVRREARPLASRRSFPKNFTLKKWSNNINICMIGFCHSKRSWCPVLQHNLSTGVIVNVPLLDLKAQYRSIKAEVLAVMEAVCDEQGFVLGPRVADFERAMA